MMPLTTENIAVFAPMPRANVSTATVVNPRLFQSVRSAYRMSRTMSSSQTRVQTARISSYVRITLPNARRAA